MSEEAEPSEDIDPYDAKWDEVQLIKQTYQTRKAFHPEFEVRHSVG